MDPLHLILRHMIHHQKVSSVNTIFHYNAFITCIESDNELQGASSMSINDIVGGMADSISTGGGDGIVNNNKGMSYNGI